VLAREAAHRFVVLELPVQYGAAAQQVELVAQEVPVHTVGAPQRPSVQTCPDLQ